MPSPLDEEEIENIIETWQDTDDPSYNKVAQHTGHNKDTVKKYVEEWQEEEGRVDDDFEEPAGTSAGNDEEDSLFTDPNEEMSKDFLEFMKLLNENMGFGLKEKAINMMAAEIEQYGQLPTQSDVVSFLESTDSGIRNANELTWIGQRYQHWKQQYEQKRMMQGDQMGGMMNPSQSGMMGGNSSQGQPSLMNGQQQGGPQQGMGMGGMNPMMWMFQQMQQQMEEMRKQMARDDSGDDDDLLKEKTEEFLETKLEQLIDADSTEEQEAVIQELRALRQEVGQQSAPQSAEMGDDWRMNLIQLAKSGQIDMSEASDLLREFGEVEADPRVIEKEYEKDIRKMEMEEKSKRQEKLADLGEKLVDRFGQSLGEAIVGGESPLTQTDGDEQETESADPNPTPEPSPTPNGGQPQAAATQPREPPAENQECKHCGAELIQGPNHVACPQCEFGVGPCDRCGYPVEIPPRGEANYGLCPDCGEIIELPDDPDATVECEECSWEGPARDHNGEVLQCDNCNDFRPIQRADQVAQRQEQVADILNTDSDDVLEADPDVMGD